MIQTKLYVICRYVHEYNPESIPVVKHSIHSNVIKILSKIQIFDSSFLFVRSMWERNKTTKPQSFSCCGWCMQQGLRACVRAGGSEGEEKAWSGAGAAPQKLVVATLSVPPSQFFVFFSTQLP